jgi:hypothetical protein
MLGLLMLLKGVQLSEVKGACNCLRASAYNNLLKHLPLVSLVPIHWQPAYPGTVAHPNQQV